MKLVVFGLSVSSSWGNGHATLWRGLIQALAASGHRVVFYERDVPYYAEHRDLLELTEAELRLYHSWDEVRSDASRNVDEADVAMVTSYCPDGVAAAELVLTGSASLRVFYDLDTPVTLERLRLGSRLEGEAERPRAVSEYLVERMVLGGANRICFVIAPGKSDILEYYGNRFSAAHISFTVQQKPAGLCHAIFQALPLIPPDEFVIVGLPDTIWFPEDALRMLGEDPLSFLLFPVNRPERFDAVLTDSGGRVQEIPVKQQHPGSPWIWGAFKLSGHILGELYDLWCRRGCSDEYIGTLVNAYLREGGSAVGVRAGEAYVDVGTLHGYREAIRLLSSRPVEGVGVLA